MSFDNKDYYQILGVRPDATSKEIKEQYKRLIKENHPDQYRGMRTANQAAGEELLKVIDEKIRQAEETCKFINEAYETLSDSAKRKAYDEEAYESSVAAPEIVVSPTKISFGTLTEKQRKSKGFTIENKGGPAASVEINWEDEPDWGEIIIEPDSEETFPIKVTIVADTTGIPSGPKNQKVLVNVDGVTHEVEVVLEVALAHKPKPASAGAGTTPPPSPTGTAPRPTGRPLGRLAGAVLIGSALICGFAVLIGAASSAAEQRQQASVQEAIEMVDVVSVNSRWVNEDWEFLLTLKNNSDFPVVVRSIEEKPLGFFGQGVGGGYNGCVADLYGDGTEYIVTSWHPGDGEPRRSKGALFPGETFTYECLIDGSYNHTYSGPLYVTLWVFVYDPEKEDGWGNELDYIGGDIKQIDI